LKKEISLFLILIITGPYLLMTLNSNNNETDKKNIEFIQSYRYDIHTSIRPSRYVEYEVLLKAIFRIYFDFSSQGIQHFSTDWLSHLETLISKRNVPIVFLMLADRMVRNLAFVTELYDIDIRTGKAIDFLEEQNHK